MSVTVNFTEKIGKIKPVNGVGQPPFTGIDFSMCDYLKRANIPYSRLHDVGGFFGGGLFVDIPNLFRDFSADEDDPESYDFAFTDLLITELVKRNTEPFFRLGVTIENYRKIKPYRIFPPADYHKWARICEKVIRHYTEGWANGFNYKITYWEIWNEPDNFENPLENQMWTGSAEEYYRLYEIAAKHLKKTFPHLKIGGYASCGFYALTNGNADFAACSPRYRYFMDFFDGFLKYIKANNCPLDFFSWHSYSGIKENAVWADYVRKRLNESGYTDTEHTLNEWNCRPDLKGTIKHAALTCGMLLRLQHTSLDSAMFYDARCGKGIYSSLFDCMTYKPLPSYYSFLAFGELYKRKSSVYIGTLPKGIYACAAASDDAALVITNVTDNPVKLELDFTGVSRCTECKAITEESVWEAYSFNNVIPPESVIFMKFDML